MFSLLSRIHLLLGRRLRAIVIHLVYPGLIVLLAGCMSLPDVTDRPWQAALAPATQGGLAQLAQASAPPATSSFRLIGNGTEALQARLALIENATTSVDLQVYQFAGDASGRALMRALRAAAQRGVRVRLLLDDLYTAGDDPLWMALASQPGIELRLFNAFLSARQSAVSRLVDSALGDEQAHRRMHNKLLVADGVLALAGGRNVADAYFLPMPQGSFVDVDVLAAGAVVPQMSLAFDLYWNSDYSHEFGSVLAAALGEAPRREDGEARLDGPCNSWACAAVEEARQQPTALAAEWAAGRLQMTVASAQVAYDSPNKVENDEVAADIGMLAVQGAQVRLLVAHAIRQAQREVLVVSPYLIPGPAGVAGVRELRERGVQVTLLTNSLAATDEPTVHLGYRKYRVALLREGAALYEWSPASGGRVLREWLAGGGPVLRLHTKAALVDREMVFLGSMNFDPRSRDLNTEFGLLVRSPELAAALHARLQQLIDEGAYRLLLQPDGRTLRWIAPGGRVLDGPDEPDTDLGSRLLLDLLEPLVPEELL
jgi:putative cardiolipin synthase